MKSLYLILTLKVLSLIGATFNSIGFLTFFFWESLVPYRWHMILGGIALIVASELLSRSLIKRLSKGEEKKLA